jgi:hypothetical protein
MSMEEAEEEARVGNASLASLFVAISGVCAVKVNVRWREKHGKACLASALDSAIAALHDTHTAADEAVGARGGCRPSFGTNSC